MRPISLPGWFLLIAFGSSAIAFAQGVSKGYYISDNTLSPDKKYGVTVWDNEANDEPPDNAKSQVIEVKTGHILGDINAEIARKNMNHDSIVPTRWTADDSMLLWQVDGKWGFNDIVLIKLSGGKIVSQFDVLAALQTEILKRTQAASPKKYAAVKATGDEFGSWYKDGFAIDCVLDQKGDGTDGPMTFPLSYQVYLTSNCKGDEGTINLDSGMTAEVSADGTIKVKDFSIGKRGARNW
jgi:hypothetical protein